MLEEIRRYGGNISIILDEEDATRHLPERRALQLCHCHWRFM
jgi:hypothetical protein